MIHLRKHRHMLCILFCICSVPVFSQSSEKTHTERSFIANIICFFSQPVDYSRKPVHAEQVILPLDTLEQGACALPEDKLLGYIWESQREPGWTVFEKQEDGTYSASIFKSPATDNDKDAVDFRNPDKSLRNKPLLGLVYCRGIRYADGMWTADYLYHPNFGLSVNKGVFFLNKDGQLIARGSKWGITATECYKIVATLQ
ncbi:MAG: DUF2147 domain-containing protein [Bacteroidales bacterium]